MSKNPESRLIGHNKGWTKSTKAFRPWKIVYKKSVGSRLEARREEKKLKSGYGREFLKLII
jgi:putative endonuclease